MKKIAIVSRRPTAATLVMLAFGLISFNALAAPEIRLVSLSGSETLEIHRGKTSLTVKEGAILKSHDEFATGPGTSARLAFPDHSQIWVGRSTSIQINSSGEVLQLVVLNTGQIRVKVPKTWVPADEKKIKFVVRTASATMGVRGTDFVVDSKDSGKKFQLHTLEGDVLTTQSDDGLIKNEGVSVVAGYFIEGGYHQAIPKPAPFDTAKYEAELYKGQPDFEKFSQTRIPEPDLESTGSTRSGASSGGYKGPNGVREKVENSLQNEQRNLDNAIGK